MRESAGQWRKAILLMSGMLVWVFALSAGLAWYQFGYLDWKTVGSMGLILMPLLVVAIGVLLFMDLRERSERTEEDRQPEARSDEAAHVLGDRQ